MLRKSIFFSSNTSKTSRSIRISMFLVLFNPFKPSVLFMDHWQIMKNQIDQTPRSLSGSTQFAYRIYFKNSNEIETYYPTTRNGFVQLIRVGIFIRHKWVKMGKLLAATRDFQQCGLCDEQRLRTACAYAQSDQSLCSSLE